MQMLLLRTIFFVAGCPHVLLRGGNRNAHTKETANVTLRSLHDAKASATHPARHQAAGAPAFDTFRQTSGDNSNLSSHLWLLLESKHYGYRHLLSNRTHAVTVSGSNPQRRLRRHKRKKLNGEMPATMGTVGGHNNSKPYSMSQRERNHRRKRGTKEHHKKTFKSSKRGPNKSAPPLTPVETYYNALTSSLTMWEPLPKPQALTSTDFPFDLSEFQTKRLDDPWDATPMTPPYAEDEESVFFPNPFYPVTSETYGAYAITIISVLIFAVGITGNIAIMCVVCHNYYMRSISNALLANLAIWDFALLLFCLPLVVFHQLTKTWLLGQFTCKVVPYIEVTESIFTHIRVHMFCVHVMLRALILSKHLSLIVNKTPFKFSCGMHRA